MSDKYNRLLADDVTYIVFTDGKLARRYLRLVDRAGHIYRMEFDPGVTPTWSLRWWPLPPKEVR